MPNQLSLTGTLFEKDTKIPLSGYTINVKTTSEQQTKVTDNQGKFSFSNLTEPEVAANQATYKLQLSAVNKDNYYQKPKDLIIDVVKGTKTLDQEIIMENRGPISNFAGKVFLASLIVGLLGLGVYYYISHKPETSKKQDINTELVNTLTQSLVDRITDDSIKVSSFKLEGETIDSLDYLFISAEYLQLKEAASELLDAAQSESSIRSLNERNIADIKKAVDKKNKAEIQAALLSSRADIKKIPSFLPKWFWTTVPGRYYEILLWALFATLLRLIGNTSYYVSRGIFFRDSIFNKFPLIVTIPLIALLIAFVISFFKISIALGDTEVSLDFSNPFVSIILATLIGLTPWKSWEFMYGLADQFIISLNRWLGLNKASASRTQNSMTEGNQPSAGTSEGTTP